jgi:hypothetical protein
MKDRDTSVKDHQKAAADTTYKKFKTEAAAEKAAEAAKANAKKQREKSETDKQAKIAAAITEFNLFWKSAQIWPAIQRGDPTLVDILSYALFGRGVILKGGKLHQPTLVNREIVPIYAGHVTKNSIGTITSMEYFAIVELSKREKEKGRPLKVTLAFYGVAPSHPVYELTRDFTLLTPANCPLFPPRRV